MSDELDALCLRMGVRPPTKRANWPVAEQMAYAREHAEKSSRFSPWAEESDIEIAGRARMLMRDDIDHENVCVAARDRICRLAVTNAELVEALNIALGHLTG